MPKYHLQFLALLVALALGILAGYLYSNSNKHKELNKLVQEHKIELRNENIKAQRTIEDRNKRISELEKVVKADSTTIYSLKDQILKHNKQVEVRRIKASKFTTDEKKKFILSRYSVNHDSIP